MWACKAQSSYMRLLHLKGRMSHIMRRKEMKTYRYVHTMPHGRMQHTAALSRGKSCSAYAANAIASTWKKNFLHTFFRLPKLWNEIGELGVIFFSNWLIPFWNPLFIICRAASFDGTDNLPIKFLGHAASNGMPQPSRRNVHIYLWYGVTFAAQPSFSFFFFFVKNLFLHKVMLEKVAARGFLAFWSFENEWKFRKSVKVPQKIWNSAKSEYYRLRHHWAPSLYSSCTARHLISNTPPTTGTYLLNPGLYERIIVIQVTTRITNFALLIPTALSSIIVNFISV